MRHLFKNFIVACYHTNRETKKVTLYKGDANINGRTITFPEPQFHINCIWFQGSNLVRIAVQQR